MGIPRTRGLLCLFVCWNKTRFDFVKDFFVGFICLRKSSVPDCTVSESYFRAGNLSVPFNLIVLFWFELLFLSVSDFLLVIKINFVTYLIFQY